MRVAILLTSNDPSAFARRFPNDGQKFRSLMHPFRPDWFFTVFPVMENIFPLSIREFDAYVVTGSPASVHDKDPWILRLNDFIKALHAERMPLIGGCFGHQAIAVALGGTVAKNPGGWIVGTETTRISKQRPWMQPAKTELILYAAHKEQVKTLPEKAELVGSTTNCPLASFTVGSHIMTTQYHPEMSRDFMRSLVGEVSSQLCTEEREKAEVQIAQEQDGRIFGEWMVRFFEWSRAQQAAK